MSGKRKRRLYVPPRIRGILRTAKYQTWRRTRVRMQRGNCHYCGQPMTEPTLDHVIPLSAGGPDKFENVVAACRPCNEKKGATVPVIKE